MPSMTLLELTQDILSDMSSDEVDSIADTVESEQVANIIRSCYFELIENVERPSFENLILLDGLSDTDHPNYLKIPDDVQKIKWIKYDYQTDSEITYTDLKYKEPEEFLQMVLSRSGADDNIEEVEDFSGATLLIVNDTNPTWWTTFDNEYVVCDSYDADIDTTLQQDKTMSWGTTEPTWVHSDTFTPDLDTNLFPMLLAEAKSTCFIRLKEVTDAKSEQQSKRQLTRSRNKIDRGNQNRRFENRPDYGRRG